MTSVSRKSDKTSRKCAQCKAKTENSDRGILPLQNRFSALEQVVETRVFEKSDKVPVKAGSLQNATTIVHGVKNASRHSSVQAIKIQVIQLQPSKYDLGLTSLAKKCQALRKTKTLHLMLFLGLANTLLCKICVSSGHKSWS